MNEEIAHAVSTAIAEHPDLAAYYQPSVPPRYAPFVRLSTNLGGMPAFGGNSVELLADFAGVFKRIAEDIDRAERFVHVEYFTVSRDEETEVVFAALERAHQRGVKVRMLMDHLGSRRYPHFKDTRAGLEAAGIEYYLSLPLKVAGANSSRPDLRNHRKIVVVDGAIGYTGSQNLIKRNYFRKDRIYYDELVARVTGPVAAQLSAAFISDWYAETNVLLNRQTAPEVAGIPTATGDALCQILPSGSGFDNDNNLKLFTALIHAAHDKLVVTNPYFVPDDSLLIAITSAAQRGVDVTLINSQAEDQFLVGNAQRSYYEELLNAGVKVYWYNPPVLLHTKAMAIDDDVAVIGSSNLDMRSFQLNLEVTLVAYDPAVVAQLRQIEAGYLEKSSPVRLDEWRTRLPRAKLAENMARLTAALQ
jgi:cardiolipin synthase